MTNYQVLSVMDDQDDDGNDTYSIVSCVISTPSTFTEDQVINHAELNGEWRLLNYNGATKEDLGTYEVIELK